MNKILCNFRIKLNLFNLLTVFIFTLSACNKNSESKLKSTTASTSTTSTTLPDTNPNNLQNTNKNPIHSADNQSENPKPTTGSVPNPPQTDATNSDGNDKKTTPSKPETEKKTPTLPTTIHTPTGTQSFETSDEQMTRICNLEFRSTDELKIFKDAPCLKDMNPENTYRLTQLMRARFEEVNKKLKERKGKKGAVIIDFFSDTFWWIAYGALLPGGTFVTAKTSAAAAKAFEKWNTSKARVEELQKWAERHKYFNQNSVRWFKSTSFLVVLTGIATSVSEHKNDIVNLVLNTPEEIEAAEIIFDFLKQEAERRSIVLETLFLENSSYQFSNSEQIP